VEVSSREISRRGWRLIGDNNADHLPCDILSMFLIASHLRKGMAVNREETS
jgi:hypothetical protein